MSARVLILQRHATDRNLVVELVRRLGYEPLGLYDTAEAFSALSDAGVRAVLVSADLSGTVEVPKLLATVARFFPATRRVLIGGAKLEDKFRYRTAAPHATLQMPTSRRELDAFRKALEQVLKTDG